VQGSVLIEPEAEIRALQWILAGELDGLSSVKTVRSSGHPADAVRHRSARRLFRVLAFPCFAMGLLGCWLCLEELLEAVQVDPEDDREGGRLRAVWSFVLVGLGTVLFGSVAFFGRVPEWLFCLLPQSRWWRSRN
jgi:hypothetical protein